MQKIWEKIEGNCQVVAEREQLVKEGEIFTLTDDQKGSLSILMKGIEEGKRRLLLKAPTGSGKTEVMMRLGASRYIDTGRPVLVIAPTRDLCRQHHDYLSKRLCGTRLENIITLNGGLDPKKRKRALIDALNGNASFIVASAMVIDNPRYSTLWDAISLAVVDDVNAFNEHEHLRHLKRFTGQILYMSATPEVVADFLRQEEAFSNQAEMQQLPFDTPPTEVHSHEVGNSHPVIQISSAADRIQEHIARGSRIYIISRLKREVSRIADHIRKHFSVPVFSLHGDMADSKEQERWNRRKPGAIKSKFHRIPMLNEFKNTKPSVLVSTNLIGSGIDIPMADFIIITDSHSFSPAEREQLIGRVGRRERESEALLLEGDSPAKERMLSRLVKSTTRVQSNGKLRYSFSPKTWSRRRGRR